MRRFVITTPNLSAGSVGSIVDATDLNMTDDKLDKFVAAGHATELYDFAPDWELDAPEPAPVSPIVFDPTHYSVPSVLDYLDENPSKTKAVIAAERAGKNRSGIVNGR